ncbi:MAG: hypothetical protein ABSA29_09065 [Terriglobales bacterium]
MRIDKLNINLSSNGYVGESEQANAACAHRSSSAQYHVRACHILSNYADWHVNRASLPSALVCWLPVQ